MFRFFCFIFVVVSFFSSAQTVYMPDDVFEQFVEDNGWGDNKRRHAKVCRRVC